MSERIAFIMENFPEDTYAKESNSNIYKILDAIAKELDIFVNGLDEVRNSKFLEHSHSENLDKIAKILGVYRFFGEDDTDFRNRINARVPSFIGGGTIKSIEGIILEYLKVNATVIEHHLPNNGFSTFHSGVIFGLNGSISNDEDDIQFLNISGGTAYINGDRFFKEPEKIKIGEGIIGESNYLFLNSNGEYIIRTSITRGPDEIRLYKITFDSINTVSLEDYKFQLDPAVHNITNTATITIQIPFDIDESILSIEEINNIIMSTKAAGVAVLMKLIDTVKEIFIIDEKYYPYFINGFSFLGSQDKIGYDKTLKSLAKNNGTLSPYKDYTFRQIGASSKGYQKYGGF